MKLYHIILIGVLIIFVLNSYSVCKNSSVYEGFDNEGNVNINSMVTTDVVNSSEMPYPGETDFVIKQKAAVNADRERFHINYPLKYDKFIQKKKDKIAQCISAVEESYDYPDSDMDSYIKKTDIPTCPEMPDMDLYIKKTDIPSCPEPAQLDVDTLYVAKTDLYDFFRRKNIIPTEEERNIYNL